MSGCFLRRLRPRDQERFFKPNHDVPPIITKCFLCLNLTRVKHSMVTREKLGNWKTLPYVKLQHKEWQSFCFAETHSVNISSADCVEIQGTNKRKLQHLTVTFSQIRRVYCSLSLPPTKKTSPSNYSRHIFSSFSFHFNVENLILENYPARDCWGEISSVRYFSQVYYLLCWK